MSYTLKYTGSEIDDILDRAVAGGTIDTELAGKQDVLTFDDAPTAGSSNPVKSGGIFDALAEKLDADGVAVTAKAILGGTPTTDTAPFLYRLNPYGNRVRPCIVGVSVGANQLVDTNTTSVTLTSGHKYAKYASGAWSIGASTGAAISVNGSNGDMLIDITLRFGSAIADKAYTLESGTAGAGVAWLRSYGLLPDGYETYNAGSIKSVNTSGRKTGGAKNLLDETTLGLYSIGANQRVCYAPFTLPSGTYTLSWQSGGISLYVRKAADNSVIATASSTPTTFTLAAETEVFITSGVSSVASYTNTDVMVEKGSTATAYEPYTSYTYPTEATDLRGVLKLSGDTIYADGDLYPPSGEGTRKYGIVDLGTLDWQYDSISALFYAVFSGCKVSTLNLICTKYYQAYVYWNGITGASSGIHMDSNLNLYIKDPSYTDAATFKQAMSDGNVQLVYELATPTTASFTPYTEIQQALTTEEWLGSEVPVGQSSEYYKDIVSAIEGIPEAPSANGTYTLKVTVSGGVATYSWEA